MSYILYTRVSTKKQGDSGLGLQAQRDMCYKMFGEPQVEFTEVESGRKNDRPRLAEAIKASKESGLELIIAKLDRLSRNAAFILALKESGVKFRCADNAEATPLTIGLLAVIAQDEAERIRTRVKEALSVKKERLAKEGKKLGAPNASELMKVNRQFRKYSRLPEDKTALLKSMRVQGIHMDEIKKFSGHLFGRELSMPTLYKYTN